MTAEQQTLLIVDDDPEISKMLKMVLARQGYRIIHAADGRTALDVVRNDAPDLVILDVMLPDMDGYTVCQRIRESSEVPVIIFTAKGDEEEKIWGLDAGADDFVSKPASMGELSARIRAALRRPHLRESCASPDYAYEGLAINFDTRQVTLKGHAVLLSALEYKLLFFLAHNAGRVMTFDEILKSVWGEDYAGNIPLLQVNIGRLRRRLGEDPRSPRHIRNEHGTGYLMPKNSIP